MSDKPVPQHLFSDVLARVQAICAAIAAEGQWPAGIDFSRVVVEPPRDTSHGDMATNAAMVLAKEAKAKPRELADKIAEKLRADDLVASVEVDVLARSAFLRYREALGESIGEIPEGLYPGDYLVPVGQVLAAEHGDKLKAMPEASWLPIVRAKSIAMMMDMIKGDLAALNIKHEVFFSERSLVETGKVTETIDFLRAKGDVYEGRLPPPKGKPVEDYEDRIQTLFRATAYGDDVDRPLLKSDGSYTYFASDIAYHKNKFDRGFRNLVDVWGADHGGSIKRMQAAGKAIR